MAWILLTPSNGSKVTSGEGAKRYVLTVNYLDHSALTPVYCKGVFLVLLFSCSSKNDLPLVLKKDIGIYADDSTPYASAPTLAEFEEKIKPDIDAVSIWEKENKMKMHPAKTKYSIISTRQKIANSAKQSLDLSVDGMQLTKVESERVLRVYIDSHLA